MNHPDLLLFALAQRAPQRARNRWAAAGQLVGMNNGRFWNHTPIPYFRICTSIPFRRYAQAILNKRQTVMNETSQNPSESRPPMIYQIRISGHLDPQWAAWFAGMTIRQTDAGETVLTGPVIDQAALFGLLRKVRDLGLPLVAVNPVLDGPADALP